MTFSFRKIETGHNLSQLFVISFLSLTLVVLIVSSSLQLAAYFRSEQKALFNNQQLIAEGASREVGSFVQEKIQVLAAAAWLTNPDTTSPEEWQLVLQSLLGLQPAFRRLAVSDPEDQTVAIVSRYSPPGLGRISDDRAADRFSEPAAAYPGLLVSDVYIDPITSEPLVSIRVPVINALREFKRTLTAELNLKFMWDLVDRLKVGKTGYTYVVDQRGNMLAFGDTARVLKGENVAHLPAVAEFMANPAALRAHKVQLYRGLAGSYVVGTHVPLKMPPWAIVTEMPWREAFGDVIDTALISLAIIGTMALVAALSGAAVSRRLTVPLVILKKTATRIAKGERALQAQVEGPDEVVQLAAAFNSMSAQLQRSLEELETQFAEITAARDALKASEERLRLAQEGTRDGIWDWNRPEDRLYFSPRCYRMLGYEPEEFPATLNDWVAHIHCDDREKTEREIGDAITSFHPFGIEFRMKARDESWRWILCRGKAVAWDTADTAARLAGSLSDITERKTAEVEKAALEEKLLYAQKMEAVALLAGGVAHDFNNMLSVILGRAELALQKMSPTDPYFNTFEEIAAVAHRSANLTRQLLAFARQQTIAPRVLDFNETITKIIKLLLRITGENIDLLWKPSTGLWPVKMDPTQVDQILANLLVNARDAIVDVGRVTVETHNVSFDSTYCDTHPGFMPGDYVLLAVSDNGCGMDKATLAKIFDPFYTTKQIGKGTGLGLATVYGIIKQNKGFINVYSEPQEGTTFRIYIPRHQSGGAAANEPDEKEAFPAGTETVLLVEDDESLLDIATAMLQQLGYTVLAADGPNAALRLAEEKNGPIHLTITDVIMPDLNGRELSHRLGAMHPAMKYLFVSGYTANVIAHQGVLEEGVHFLQKPFSLKKLATTLRRVLDGPVNDPIFREL